MREPSIEEEQGEKGRDEDPQESTQNETELLGVSEAQVDHQVVQDDEDQV